MSQNARIFIFENSHTLCNHFLKRWVELTAEAVRERGRFVAALSGGKAPVEFFCKLSNLTDFDYWRHTHLFLTDERFVDADDDASNFRMISENLTEYVPIPRKQVHGVPTREKDPAQSATRYEEALQCFFKAEKEAGTFPTFDLVHLGIGPDGHTASLFPHHAALQETQHWTVPVASPALDHPRISLTLPVINRARHIFFLVTGKQKAEIIQKIIEGPETFYPASHVAAVGGELVFLLDRDAASLLPYRESYEDRGEGIEYLVRKP